MSNSQSRRLEEWALRGRNGRLQDLGFPPLEDAKRIYAWLSPEQLVKLPTERRALEVGPAFGGCHGNVWRQAVARLSVRLR